MSDAEKKQRMLEIFQKHDTKKSGFVETTEVARALDEIFRDFMFIGFQFSNDDVEKLINRVDKDNDEKIKIDDRLNVDWMIFHNC